MTRVEYTPVYEWTFSQDLILRSVLPCQVSQRWEVAAQQLGAWQAAAEALSQLEAGHQEASAVVAARSAEVKHWHQWLLLWLP